MKSLYKEGDMQMYKINFSKPINVHFMGIGGISMSGLAEILLKAGFKVTGSDMKASEITDQLADMGALINIGQCASNISDNIDLVVYTAAIHPDNEEFKAAEKGHTDADQSTAPWPDHGELQVFHRRERHPRKDYNNIHAVIHPDRC